MLLQRHISGLHFRTTVDMILKQADDALLENRLDEVSSLIDIVYAIYDNDRTVPE